jgi:hypothetical protein
MGILLSRAAFAKKRKSGTHATMAERELELELIQTQTAQKQVLWAEVLVRALRASQIVERAEVRVNTRCA